MLEYNGTTGAFVTTFVGSLSGGLATPLDLVFGPNGNLFVSTGGLLHGPGAGVQRHDRGLRDRLRRRRQRRVGLPRGLVFGPNGNLFVASQGSDQVLEYNGTTGAFVTAFVGAGSGGLAAPMAWCSGPTATSS